MRSEEEGVAYSIVYAADYRYSRPVRDQHNLLRIRPTQNDRQRLEAFDLDVDPSARVYEHRDYFGTYVIQFEIADPHESLRIRAEARVRAMAGPEAPEAGWERLSDPRYVELGAEYLGALEPAADPRRIASLVEETAADSPLETVINTYELIPERFEYRPGATYVGSTVEDLLEGGAGVCQDFVHLALTMLRSQGIACRYVSGYLFAPGENGSREGTSAEVDTHAWLEALLPAVGTDAEPTWIAVDPTNKRRADRDHVKIGHGRAYSDVPPIRGVFKGEADSEVEVNVKMTIIDSDPTPSP
jgi:transglutaminase-like putative cysteine protease